MSKGEGSSEDVAKVSEELYQCRSRLEAGVEENKRNREVIQGLSDQIQRFRQRTAEREANIAGSLPHLSEVSTSIVYSDDNHSLYRIHDIRPTRNNSLSRLDQPSSYGSPILHQGDGHLSLNHSSPRLNYMPYECLDVDEQKNIDAMFSRLKSELFKNNTLEEINELLREENDAALIANENLRSDVVELTKALEQLEQHQRDDQERFTSENMRYRNQVESQHRQLISLWKAFTSVKRQVRDLHTSTANDLDKQMTEFSRCAAMMQKAIRHVEYKNSILQERLTKEKDDVLDDILAKYENSSANSIEAEKNLGEKTRQLMRVESQLKRVKEENEDLTNAINRICQMPELNTFPTKQRARSASPALAQSSNDAMRKIRLAMTAKWSEIRDANDRREKMETELARLKRKLETHERAQEHQRDAEKFRAVEISERDAKITTLEHELRRTQERVRLLEEEKISREGVMANLQNNLTSTHRVHKEFIEDLMERHREELDTRERLHETELEGRVNDERGKADKARVENEKTRKELEEIRQQLRDLRVDHSALTKAIDEKDFNILNLEENLTSLKERIEEEISKSDEKDNELLKQNLRIEEMKTRETELKQELTETQNVHKVVDEDNKALEDEIAQLRNEISSLTDQIETAKHQEEEYKLRFATAQQSVSEQENSFQALKTSIKDLEIRLESTLEEARHTRDDLDHHKQLVSTKNAELVEVIRQLDETKREHEVLIDDFTTSQNEVAFLNARVLKMEGDIDLKQKEEIKLLSLLDDLRSNCDLLTNESHQKSSDISILQEKIEELTTKMKNESAFTKAEAIRLDQVSKLKQKEMEEEWAENLTKAQNEADRTKNALKECENKLKDLTAQCNKLINEESVLKVENDELKSALNETTSKYKKQIESLIDQNTCDREEWEREREELHKTKSTAVSHLREELNNAESDIKETLLRESQLRKDIEELKDEIESLHRKIEMSERQHEEKEEASRVRDLTTENERRTLVNQVEEQQLKIFKVTTQLEETNRKQIGLQTEIAKLESVVANKEQAVKDLETKIENLMENIKLNETHEQTYKDTIALMERENTELKALKEKLTNKMTEERKKVTDLEQKLRESNKGLHNVRLKAQSEEEQKTNRDEKVQILTNKIRQMEIQLADKTAKNETMNDIVKKMESDGLTMAQELSKEKQVNVDIAKMNDDLRNSCKTLNEDLNNVRSALEKKTASSKKAMNELVSNYREAERRSDESQTECEHLKAHINALSTKIERVEKKKRDLEDRISDVESRNAELTRKVNQYERSAKMALNMAKYHAPLRSGTSTIDIPRISSSPRIADSHLNLRTASSSHDISVVEPPERSVHHNYSDPSSIALDMSSSMEITLRYLKERIEQLEKDKVDLTNELHSNRIELKTSTDRLKETAGMLQKLEKKVDELQEENRQLESRLNSQRQLYLSNEEVIRAKDADYRGLKAKILSAELHLREKDSKINQLMIQLDSLKLDLAEMTSDKQKLSNVIKETDEELKTMEEERMALESDKSTLTKQFNENNAELKVIVKRLEDSDAERERLERILNETKRVQQRDRDLIEKLQGEEKHWRQEAVTAKKSSEHYHKSIYEEKLSVMQHNHDALAARNERLNADIDKMKQDLRESNHRYNLMNQKLSDTERRISDANHSKSILTQQIIGLQKMETDRNRLEKEMTEELKQLRRDKLVLTSESEELKRRVFKADIEKKEIEGFRARLEREVAALKRHIDALEEEKTRTHSAVRETMSERKAIDKSLAAMERENMELYRNCGQLQSQIVQLERNTEARSVAKMVKDQTELEARVVKLLQEKKQLEKVIEQKDATFSHKQKMMESQLLLLKEQLEVERKNKLAMQRDGRNGSVDTERRIQRPSDLRVSKLKPIQRQKSPFREQYRCISCERVVSYFYESSVYSSFISNTASTSVGTLIM